MAGFNNHRRYNQKLRGILWTVACCALLAILSFQPIVTAQDQDKAQIAIERAIKARNIQDYQAAKQTLSQARQDYPDNIQLHLLEAQNYIDLVDAIGAEIATKNARKAGANDMQLRRLKSNILYLKGEYDKALMMLTQGALPTNQQAESAHLLGNIQLVRSEYDKARTAYDLAINSGLDSAMLWSDIARYRFALSDSIGAIEALEFALERDPYNIIALKFRGELMRRQFGLTAALPWFERALQLAPNDLPILAEYAATLGDLGRYKEMLKVTRLMLSIRSDYPRALYLQAVMCARAGKMQLAQALMLRAKDKLDDIPAAMLLNGAIAFHHDNYALAIDWLEKLIKLQPYNQQARKLLARSYLANGEYDVVIKFLQPDISRPAAARYNLLLFAMALEGRGQGEVALGYRQSAANYQSEPLSVLPEAEHIELLDVDFQLKPDSPAAIIPKIRKLIAENNLDTALSLAVSLREKNPYVADANILLGDLYYLRGRYSNALEYYDIAGKSYRGPSLLRRLVATMSKQDRGEDVERLLLEYAGFNPANITSLKLLANLYVDHQDWLASERVLRELHQRLGDWHSGIAIDYAYVAMRARQLEPAMHSARIAYHGAPDIALASHVYGLAVGEAAIADLSQAKIGLSVELLEKASRLQPQNPWLSYHLARSYDLANMPNKASRALALALEQGPFPERDAALALRKKLAAKNTKANGA